MGLEGEGTGLGALGLEWQYEPTQARTSCVGDVCVLHCHPGCQQGNVACVMEELESG